MPAYNWLLFLVVVSVALIKATPVASVVAAPSDSPAPINANDFFQIPADLFLHGHSLARHSEQIRASKQLAHRVKTVNGWSTASEAQMVSIKNKVMSDSFFYHNSINGAVTNITSVFETVSDTAYFDQIPSVTSVSCNGDFISVKFNLSVLDETSKDALTFGSKCEHYAPGIHLTGGNSYFCSTPSDSAAHVFREIIAVVSCVQDPASGRASFINLHTTDANPLTFYKSVSDFSINGSMALIPKRLFRTNSKVDFFALSRQLWREREERAHLRDVKKCDGVMTDEGYCYDITGTTTAYIGLTAQKSAYSAPVCLNSLASSRRKNVEHDY
jgi:hypothetical protein